MVSFENFVKSMQPSLSELKVTPSFCFPIKIPDDRAVTNVYCQLTQKTNENASPSYPPPRFAAAAGQKLKLIGFSKFVRLGKQSTKLVDEISVHCEVIGPACSIFLFPSKIELHPAG